MTTRKTKRKPVLPALTEVRDELMEFWEGDTLCDMARQEIAAAEKVIRAARRYIGAHPDGYGLRRAVAALDKLTRRTP